MFSQTTSILTALAALVCNLALGLCAAPSISLSTRGTVIWTNATVPGVSTVQQAGQPTGPWLPIFNAFATNPSGAAPVSLTDPGGFYRLRSVDVSATPQGFTNFAYSYGVLETIAGTGAGQLDINYWQYYYEGWPATWVQLSRPHYAMADRAGNIYIVDKNSHSILKLWPQGTITTLAGTHTGGFNGEGPALATTLQLNFPNGEWVRGDGTVYVFDTNNGRIRRVDTNAVMTTLFMATIDGSAVSVGRGLWVKDDESLAYFCAGTKLKKWTPSAGVKNLAGNFVELGDLVVVDNGDVIACDRGANLVFRVSPSGASTVLAGNGTTTGGGDGYPATQTGLYGARAVWPVPTGGYLLLTHEGCQLWYLDTAGIIHLLLNGARGNTHYGDGSFFYSPGPKISEGRSVTMDYTGNVIVCESDYGFIRRIRFLPLTP